MAPNKKSDDVAANKASVGYRRPPPDSQFKKGQSGNPKGRPKRRPNVATLTKLLFNESVLVRQDGKPSHMPSGEAVFRSLVAQAARGDTRSLFAFMDILEMTGLTNDISDEEREKRAMHLPNSFSLEEWDLINNPACQREREYCRMMAESEPEKFARPEDGTLTVVIPESIQLGDALAGEHKFDEALAAYRQEIEACKVDLAADSNDKTAQDRFRRAVSRIALLADALLFASDFARAMDVCEEALGYGSSPFWVDTTSPLSENILTTGTTWISAIRAHAWMLSGQAPLARSFYCSFASNPKFAITSSETSILRDFVRLRKVGLTHPLMDEIEKRYSDQGWTTDILNTKRSAPKLKPQEIALLLASEQLNSGDKLRENGYPHEALTVYLRNLKNWQKNAAKDGTRDDWKQNVVIAAERVALTIQELFRRGKFTSALENANAAVELAPENPTLQAVRACALMLQNHDTEARVLFMWHRGKPVGSKTWEATITDQFAELRGIGCARPLMDEIERRFAGTEVSEFRDVDVSPERENSDPSSALMQASDIASAEALENQGLFEQALVVYGLCLAECNAKIRRFEAGVYNSQVIDDRTAIAEKLGHLAMTFLKERDFAKALEAIDLAVSANNSARLNIWHAHVLMFLNRIEEAKVIYREYGRQTIEKQTGISFILNDIAALRRHNLSHAFMDEIEALFTTETHQIADCEVGPPSERIDECPQQPDESEQLSDSREHLRKIAERLKLDHAQHEAEESTCTVLNTPGGTYPLFGVAQPPLRRPAG
jgi:tetratricopeptide (TPR) repeat protein